MNRISHIGYDKYNLCLSKGGGDYFKALAFAVIFKSKIQSSVVKGYSVRKMAKIMGSTYKTISKYMALLQELGIAYFYYKEGVKYMKMGKLRHHKIETIKRTGNYITPNELDFIIPQDIDINNVPKMMDYLCACFIKLKADQQAYFQRNCIKSDKRKRNKNPKRETCSSPLKHMEYANFGIARATIRKRFHCGNTRVSRAIKLGDDRLFLKATRKFVFDPNNNPMPKEFKIGTNYHTFFNRQGKYCICLSNCYFSTLPQYYADSIVSQLDLILAR